MPICRQLWALLMAAAFLLATSSAGRTKDTGLIFVSNEKTNNIIIIDPKTYKVVKDFKTSR